jgi:hypothetical protein
MSCDRLTLGKINFWIHSKSGFTSPATFFECYDGTDTETGRRRFQQWVGCNLGTLKKSSNFCPSTPSRQIAKCMFLFEKSYFWRTLSLAHQQRTTTTRPTTHHYHHDEVRKNGILYALGLTQSIAYCRNFLVNRNPDIVVEMTLHIGIK